MSVFCSDDKTIVCGVNENALESAINGYIPDLNGKVYTIKKDADLPSNYAILDFVEFIVKNLWDYKEEDYHSYLRHNHFSFSQETELKLKFDFREEINHLFERNGITFYLDMDGLIKRQLPIELDVLLSNLDINTSDTRLNELIYEAVNNIKKPKRKDREYALEKLWDSFERMKTYYSENKKTSAELLVKDVAGKTVGFDILLDEEFRTLTKIGNDFQIRHFESGTMKIEELNKTDYLFYRMVSLINLCIGSIELQI